MIRKAFEAHRFTTSRTEERLQDFQTEDYETTIVLTPIKEDSEDYNGPFRNQNYSNLQLFLPTEAEVRECYNLPEIGIPLGEAIISEVTGQKVPYFLPYNPSTSLPDSDDWQIDHSVLVVGSQGTGKTNLLIYFACLLASVAPEEVGTRIISSGNSG